jgi:ferredoxin
MTEQRLTVDPIVRADVVPTRSIGDVRGAVAACPTLALRLRANR